YTTLFRSALLLVGPFDAGRVLEARHGLPGDDVRLEDVPEVALLDAAVPDVVGIHDHHRAVPALREAAGLVDPDVVLETGPRHLAAKVLHEPPAVALGRAGIAPGAHEDVDAVLRRQSSAGAVAPAA